MQGARRLVAEVFVRVLVRLIVVYLAAVLNPNTIVEVMQLEANRFTWSFFADSEYANLSTLTERDTPGTLREALPAQREGPLEANWTISSNFEPFSAEFNPQNALKRLENAQNGTQKALRGQLATLKALQGQLDIARL